MKEIFNVNETSYNLRDSRLMYLPSFNKIMYRKNTFQYYGSHLWNLLLNDIKKCMDLYTFKTLIISWDGPRCQCNVIYVMFYRNVTYKYLYILYISFHR